jgi:hypothetical protein
MSSTRLSCFIVAAIASCAVANVSAGRMVKTAARGIGYEIDQIDRFKEHRLAVCAASGVLLG